MRLEIHLCGELPPRCDEALRTLGPDLGIVLSDKGLPVRAVRGSNLHVGYDGTELCITWGTPVQFYRALSLIPVPLVPFAETETPCIETVGIMFDVSRNAVLKPETMRFFLRKMALMGLSLAMMYTEDTYEVPGQPYFGHLRGRYSHEELRLLDDYADMLGIELCPCIQTLGHLNRVLHWPSLAHLKDNEEVLLADEEQTYAFLEQIIKAASAPYRSKRIHIGMDEAHGIGLGTHLRKYGYESPHAIIRRHLARVLGIVKRNGLSPMMWSDMYFRPDSPTGGYYDSGTPTEDAIAAVSRDTTLVYWDYYHETEQEYADMLQKHAVLPAPTAFAGGIWTWCGPAPDYDKTIAATVPALTACKKAGISLVLATAWGDNGAEANLFTALLGMQLYAEFAYRHGYDPDLLAQRFRVCCHADANAFLSLSQFNTVPGMLSGKLRPVNAAKFLLYQDPLVQLFAGDTAGLSMRTHYEKLWHMFKRYATENEMFEQLFTFYALMAKALARKCSWHENASTVVKDKNLTQAALLAEELTETINAIEELRLAWFELWNTTNKPFGFEIIDARLGGVKSRLATAQARMRLFAMGECEDIPELSTEPLPYTLQADGTLFGSYAVGEIMSACKIDI